MIKSEKSLCRILKFSLEELREIESNIDSYYKPFPKKEYYPDGRLKKIRICAPSSGELLLIHGRLASLLKQFPISNAAHGGVEGRSHITNTLVHWGNQFSFTSDLKNFFPSIKPPTVYQLMLSLGFSPKVSAHIARLVTYKGAVPLGIKTSTLIANLVLRPMDEQIEQFAHVHGLRYSRHIDDITISGKYPLNGLSAEICSIIAKSGFKINRKKVHVRSGRHDITGTFLTRDSIDVNAGLLEKIKYSKPGSDRLKTLLAYRVYVTKARPIL